MGISMYRRRAIIGALSGLASSPALLATLDNVPLALLAGMAIGAGFAVIFRPSRHAYMDTAMTAAATGVPLWIVISVLARPLVISHAAAWDSAGMRALFPALVGWVLYGALLGVLLQACTDAARRWLGPDEEQTVPRPAVRTRVVILGGGFAGVTTAAYLEHLFGADPTISLTLVSETNALLFTPMLAEVAASSLEPTHISSPLRTSLRRTSVVRGRAAAIDLDRRCVALAPDRSLAPGTGAALRSPGAGLGCRLELPGPGRGRGQLVRVQEPGRCHAHPQPRDRYVRAGRTRAGPGAAEGDAHLRGGGRWLRRRGAGGRPQRLHPWHAGLLSRHRAGGSADHRWSIRASASCRS